jgi:solute:Na+ symporter, SSS family
MGFSDSLIELGTLAVYLAVLLWIGVRSARDVKTSADYTLAGRSIPWVIVLATTAATMIGGGASVGMVAGVAEVGIAAALITCAWHLQLIFTGLFVAPKLRGLNLVTVGDYIHLKFGPLAREVAVASCLLFLIGGLAAQMAAIGAVANSILDLDYRTAMLIGAAVTVFYSTVGGISAVVKTDVLQFVILVVGIGVASAIVAYDYGGISAMSAALPEQFAVASHWSPMRTVSLFFAFLLGETFVPVYTVRCFIARDSRQARWGVAGAGIFLLLFMPIATLVLGTGVRLDPDVRAALAEEKRDILDAAAENGESVTPAEAERKSLQIAFPTLVRTRFPPLLAGLVIAAIIAAVMSSADSCLSCLATVVMEDAYRRHVNPAASDRQLLRVAQWSTLLAGAAATACAWYFRNIADILEFVYDFWAPTMILPFLVAVFWYRETRVCAVVVSMFAGAAAAVLWRFVLKSPGDVGPALFGVAAAVAAYCVTLPFTRRAPTHRLLRPATEDP